MNNKWTLCLAILVLTSRYAFADPALKIEATLESPNTQIQWYVSGKDQDCQPILKMSARTAVNVVVHNLDSKTVNVEGLDYCSIQNHWSTDHPNVSIIGSECRSNLGPYPISIKQADKSNLKLNLLINPQENETGPYQFRLIFKPKSISSNIEDHLLSNLDLGLGEALNVVGISSPELTLNLLPPSEEQKNKLRELYEKSDCESSGE